MGRGASGIGVFATVTVAAALLAGCGDSSSSRPSGPPHSLAEARTEPRESMNSELTKLDTAPRRIACIDRNVAAMTGRQFAERVIEPRIVGPGAPRETAKGFAGAFGKGCF